MTRTEELTDLVRDLARARADLARVEAELEKRREEWMARWEEENADLIHEWGSLKTGVEVLEEEVRERAAEIAAATGDKEPAPGVKIRVIKRLKYDASAALEWALSRGMREVLKLDKRAFEKAAKAIKPDVVEIVEELQPTIARDLDAALGDEEGPQ